MFIKIDSNNKIISITANHITKDNKLFLKDPNFIWTDKEFDNEKIINSYTAFYNAETDEIYYKEEVSETIPVLSETEEAILNTNVNVEYLVALQELNL